MDRNFISSELSFYDFVDHDGTKNMGGAHLFGNRSLMWAFWFPKSVAVGRNVLMVDLDRKRVEDPTLRQYFVSLGPACEESLQKNGRLVGYFYWRVGYQYRGDVGEVGVGSESLVPMDISGDKVAGLLLHCRYRDTAWPICSSGFIGKGAENYRPSEPQRPLMLLAMPAVTWRLPCDSTVSL